jgi:hypothetical protein
VSDFDHLEGHDPAAEEAVTGPPAPLPVEADEAGGDVDGDGEVTGYEGYTKAELADELERRGLPKSGNVPDLVERLEADDAEQAQAASADAEENIEPV